MGNPLPTSGLDLRCAVLNFTGIPVVRNNPHSRYMGETRPDLSKVGNRVFTTIPLLPMDCLSVVGQNWSHDL